MPERLENPLCKPSGDRPSLSATYGPERSPLWLCRFDRLTNSRITLRRASLAQGLSPFTNPLPLSLLTSHFSRLTAALAAQRFKDLFLAFPQGIDLGRLAVAGAFGAARNLEQVSGGGTI